MLAAITAASVCLMRISSDGWAGVVTDASRVKADIKQHSRGVKIIDNFGNSLNQPTLPSGSNEWFYGPARANDDRIQNWPEKKLVIDKIAQRVIEQIQSHSLSLMHSHIFCDFLLQN